MWPEGTAADLQALMQLKGTKRSDQQAILEAFGSSAPSSSSSSAAGGASKGPSASSAPSVSGSMPSALPSASVPLIVGAAAGVKNLQQNLDKTFSVDNFKSVMSLMNVGGGNKGGSGKAFGHFTGTGSSGTGSNN
jgi:hypothetical protein